MDNRTILAGLAVAGSLVLTANAQETPTDLEPLDSIELDLDLDPDFDVTPSEDQVVQELRVRGRVRGYRIEPKWGAPYYLYDLDGNGRFDRINESELSSPGTAQWELFRKKRSMAR